jgi:DNA mismatch repair protein MutS
MPPRKNATGVKKGPSYATSMQVLYLKHYQEQCAKYGPKTVVLMQIGGFFEMYDVLTVETGVWAANVQSIAELCGSAVQPKPSSDPGKQTFFWGFPEVALEKYEPLITAAGYSVVVITQTKDATGEVTARTIDHVSSPGIYAGVVGTNNVRKEEQIMLTVYVEPYVDRSRGATHWYLASSAFDVTTGKSVSMETDLTLIDGKPVLDVVTPFWSVYPPAEVCFYWVAASPAPSQTQILSMFAGAATGRPPLIHVYSLDPKHESAVATDRIRGVFLAETFRHDSALSVEEHLDVTRYAFARRSLYQLLTFVKDHNPSYLTLLHEHSIWTPDENVLLGNSALEQLGMLPLSTDKEHESLLAWLQKAQTAMGRRALRERLLKPIADVEILEERQERIAALRADLAGREALEKILRGAFDLSRIHRRFQLGSAGTEDLIQLYTTYERAAALLKATEGKLFEPQDAAGLQTHLDSVLCQFSLERIRKTREQVGDHIAVGSVHPWKRGVHAALDAHEDAWAALETQMTALRGRLEEILGEADVIKWELRDDAPFTFLTTQRRASSLVAVGKRRSGVDLGTIKRGSSGQVQLTCPELEVANAAGLKIRSEWRTTLLEIWKSEWIAWTTHAIDNGTLHGIVDWLGELDTEMTLARLSDLYGYVRPSYATEGAGFAVYGLRHPIIERIHTNVPYISHNLVLGSFASGATITATAGGAGAGATSETENTAIAPGGVLLYGVNAAGKSSLGKAIGLAVIMAQTGMPVPASTMTLVPYKALFTRILGNDNLWAGMSSFVVEMTEFRSILRSAAEGTLVIGDELCAGTETASATSIVAAGVKTLADRGAHFFFATHLHELAEIPEIANHVAVRAYHLTVHPSPTQHGALVYDRLLRTGTGSPMYGLEVCRGLDMDREFLAAAFDFRKRLFSEDGSVRPSRYNTAVIVSACEICGSREGLETHHIVPQAAADTAGRIGPGTSKHHEGNLVALCGSCHDKHHGGLLEIQGWKTTTKGRTLIFKTFT